jgi:hypothetical protein
MKKMPVTLSVGLALWLAGGAAFAQVSPPAEPPPPRPRINRNPAFRQSLPPAPPVVPDPRDSTTRPVMPAEQPPTDGRSVVLMPPAPQAPASAPALPASGIPGR